MNGRIKRMGCWSYLIVMFFLISPDSFSQTKTEISDLRCEYLENPAGIDSPQPRFSWKIVSTQRGVSQQAYQVLVSENRKEIDAQTGKCWNSGKVTSSQAMNVMYEGIPLKSDREYFWSVCVWIDGHPVWSPVAVFHTGLLDKTDWQAKWITTPEEIVHASPELRKEFLLHKKVKKAFAFVSAAGLYEFYLNGGKVGDHVLDPAITDYRKAVLYATYDVSGLLKKGKNVAGAMLGNGAYNFRKIDGRYVWGGKSLGNPCFIMQINVTYTDGSESVIITDESWKYASGPIAINNFYAGEDYDARKEQKGWLTEGFKDQGWGNVVLAKEPGGVLRSQSMPPVKVVATVQPVTAIHDSTGVYLFDLGQNIPGWWRLHIKGKAGETIRVRGAETLNDSLFPAPLRKGDRISTKYRYHAQVWTDYTLKDDQEAVYEPRFFYTGYRYLEVTTFDKQDLPGLKAEGRVVHTALESNGTFLSSDALLNKIYRATLWSEVANLVGYPTDCPHREKGAYCGDGQVVAESSMDAFQMASFYSNWLNDMSDAQEENGRIPNTAPTLVGGYGGGVAWGSAYILLPWWMYHYYDDIRVLQEHYAGMKKYISYLKKLGTRDENPKEPYIINNFDEYWYSLGEWCAPGQHDCPNHAVVNTFYYYYNTLLMSEIARVLGYPQDARYYLALSDTIKRAFNQKFFDPYTCLYGTKETYQTYQLLALVGNLAPEGSRARVFQSIVDDIRQRGNHLNTGIIGTKYLWPVLVEGNESDLAFEVATQTTYPGYGYWFKNGCTTLLEEWNGDNSHNHQMFGSIVEYFYKYLAGIQSPLEGHTTLGYQHVYLRPYVPERLNAVKATQTTVAGTITSDWKKDQDSFQYTVSIPANTTATVVLPASGLKNILVLEGDSVIWQNGKPGNKVPGISEVKAGTGQIIVSIGSGTYHFVLKGTL